MTASQRLRVLAPLSLGLALTACPCPDPETPSDEGRLLLIDDLSFAGRLCGEPLSAPIVVGTSLCGSLRCQEGCPDDEPVDVTDCFEASVEGPAHLSEEGCLVIDGPGTVRWSFGPRSCVLRDDGYTGEGDAFTLVGISPDEVLARDRYPDEEAVSEALSDPEALKELIGVRFVSEPPLPEDLVPPPRGTRRVFAG